MKQQILKNKTELDLLSYDEILDYRDYTIGNSKKVDGTVDGTLKRYLDELHFYKMVRFKDGKLAMIGRWRKYPDAESFDFILKETDEETYQWLCEIHEFSLGEMRYII